MQEAISPPSLCQALQRVCRFHGVRLCAQARAGRTEKAARRRDNRATFLRTPLSPPHTHRRRQVKHVLAGTQRLDGDSYGVWHGATGDETREIGCVRLSPLLFVTLHSHPPASASNVVPTKNRDKLCDTHTKDRMHVFFSQNNPPHKKKDNSRQQLFDGSRGVALSHQRLPHQQRATPRPRRVSDVVRREDA